MMAVGGRVRYPERMWLKPAVITDFQFLSSIFSTISSNI